MITRAGFVARVLGAPLVALGLAVEQTQPDPYVPCGHLGMDYPVVANVDHVTLNGQEITGVFELNDVEGWLRRYTGWVEGGQLRVQRLAGEVRVHWKDPD